MYSDTFLTVCPVCKTVQENLRFDLNKEIPCTGCLSRFTAQENFINVEKSSASRLTAQENFIDVEKPCASRLTAQKNFINVEKPSASRLTPVQVDEEQCNDHNRLSKRKTTPDVTTDKLLMPDPESSSDDFKNFIKEEIRRQILNGLGEACRSAEIEAVEVEEMRRCTVSSLHDSVPEEQQYMVKTKLMVTVHFPVTVRSGQGPPQDCLQPMEDYTQPKEPEPTGMLEDIKEPEPTRMMEDDIKEPEPTGMIEDIKEPEPTGMMEDIKEAEPTGMMEDIKEPESGGLMKPEKFNDEPLFENENSEEVDVPESEFYDFYCDRSEDKFSPGQIWASYDSGRDVMPRDYVQIKKVMSVNPFKVEIALLEPRSFLEWVKAGNSVTCGEFSIENMSRVMDQIDGFSHIIKWEKGQKDMICIYPSEREVWALYKDWKELDPNRRIKVGYEIVQIVAIEKDFTVSAVPLINYKGSRTVFLQQQVEPFNIYKRDFVRFSHQIAMFEILDLEGCLELDPAATPH